MEIKVNEQTQRFYLAFDEWVQWVPAVGHGIKVGQYHFCAIPLSDSINVSEVTSGVKAISVPINLKVWMLTSTKEDTMRFLEKVGEHLKIIMEERGDFDELLKKQKKIAFERLGAMPPIENIDTDWIFEEESEVVH
ncbi:MULTISPECIES: hypothetical protein [Bacillus cereus group]|uniref:Uncharacterized protein n=7 Tax=root TaxID=1 RepID=I3WU18_9CAUD|nr:MULTISPECIES: hypothetical protein [Bacillus cereus group]YP_006488714.1 hypothetical protein BTCS33_gp44 [Bacillus phage BtCS33]ALN97356.1 hypothetical protein XO27_0050 [Bacillus phage phi4I1]AUO78612.1 hypothetical protein XO27_0050 [Bacillus phage BtiUFT6.51-F]AFL46435.1 hypothetical protein BtCS33_44 [Bacillus phage BtCS33]AGE76348.1 hypothetical protein HD73_0769 [Bacillus thuringiensis serovar kurstaki str. HD73]AGE77841.1 hypothetical protein HD73_2263 [Bacillus thuringiensis serov